MKYSKIISLLAAGCLVMGSMALTGCSGADVTSALKGEAETEDAEDEEEDAAETGTVNAADMFTERDLDQTYDEDQAVSIALDGTDASCENDRVTVSDGQVTITGEGVYVLTGSYQGQILVDAEDAKVQLVLAGAEIDCSDSAAIYVRSADKVFVTTAKNTENTLTTSGNFEADGDTNVDGVIFAKDDITINGQGTLTIETDYGHGIVGKNDVKLTGGEVTIESTDHAISGKDSVRITGVTLRLTSDVDAIHAGSSDEDSDGFVYIQGGTIVIEAGDDGIHADGSVTIDGGTVDIGKSYEGIEGQQIYVNGGTITVKSSDDGFNAAGGADGSGFGGFGGDRFGGADTATASSSDYELSISGGTIVVDADGDGLDSNGNLYISGGDTLVYGPTSSENGAIDYGEGCVAEISGGTIIACGSSGMAENFSDGSTQGAIMVTVSQSNVSGDVKLLDEDGNVLLSTSPTKQYNNVVLSCPQITDGSTYTVQCGDASTEVTMDGLIYGEGNGFGFGGNMGGGQMGGGQMGGFGFGGQMGDSQTDDSQTGGQKPGQAMQPQSDGSTMPEMPDGGSMPSQPGNGGPMGNAMGQTQNGSSDSSDSTAL